MKTAVRPKDMGPGGCFMVVGLYGRTVYGSMVGRSQVPAFTKGDHMQIQQLVYFMKIAELGSMNKAAAELNFEEAAELRDELKKYKIALRDYED